MIEVSAISGHKELQMLARYTHLRAVDLVQNSGPKSSYVLEPVKGIEPSSSAWKADLFLSESQVSYKAARKAAKTDQSFTDITQNLKPSLAPPVRRSMDMDCPQYR